jgi:hypothetical protein
MKEFKSPGAFARYLRAVAGRIEAAETAGLEKAAVIVEREAKASIGTYQEGWAPLSPATLEGFFHPLAGWIPGKIETGYAPPDNPLLRTGALREDYEHTVARPEMVVGSNSDIAVWQEMGTPDAVYPIPPRAVLGGAMKRRAGGAIDAIMQEVMVVIAGTRVNRWD